MNWQDAFNGFFECFGGFLVWLNVRAVFRDKGYAGVRPSIVMFFLGWSIWDIYYYPHLGQWWSFWGGVSIMTANIAWIATMLYFGRKK